jgi:hypothetical protein
MIWLIPLSLIIFIGLFVLFLENRFSFDFSSPNIWKIRWENIFFKYSFGSDGINFEFFLKSPKKEKEYDERKKEKNYTILQEQNVKEEREIKTKKEEIKTEKPEIKRQKVETSKEKNIPKEKKEEEIKDDMNWVNFAKNIWEKEEKTIKALIKFAVRIIKLSLKLLTPAKIEMNLFGGFSQSAETGWLYSLFILFNSFFENNKKISLNFTPDFTEFEWKFDGHINYRFSIAKIFLFLLTIIVCFPYFAVIKSLIRNRKLIWKKKSGLSARS